MPGKSTLRGGGGRIRNSKLRPRKIEAIHSKVFDESDMNSSKFGSLKSCRRSVLAENTKIRGDDVRSRKTNIARLAVFSETNMISSKVKAL